MAEWEWKWKHKLASKKDWFVKYNPDMAEEDIEEKLEEVKIESEPKKQEPQQQGLLGALARQVG